MNIGIDVDGVLVDLESYQRKAGVDFFENKLGRSIVNPAGYDLCDIYGCSKEEREKFWIRYIWAYCLTLPAIKGAAEAIKELHADGNRIVIITGRAHTAEHGVTGWLFRYMLRYWLKKNKIVFDEIFFCDENSSAKEKFRICREQRIDIMVDDKPEILTAVCQERTAICYPAVWNRNIAQGKIISVKDWDEIYHYISQYKKFSSGSYFKH